MKYFLFIFLILLQILLDLNLSFQKGVSNICEIKIKIKGTGPQSIFDGSNYFKLPDEIYLEKSKIGIISNRINLTKKETTIILRWNSTFQSCKQMFFFCSNITEIDLSSFNNPDLVDMTNMFINCKSLTSINFSSFNTSKVTSMNSVFRDCYNLVSLNLSTFNTSNVINMNLMFYKCISLTSLDLSNFDTSKVIQMAYMFSYCSNLSFLDISSFKTPRIKILYHMFQGCESLTSLIFSNFNASVLTDWVSMFAYCINLKYIDFSNAIDNSNLDFRDIFKNFGKNLTVCINKAKAPKLFSKLIELNSTSINCSFISCKYYHYYDNEEKKCTETEQCPKKYNKLILEKTMY